MLITKVSILTGIEHTKEIPVTAEQIAAWEGGMVIQNAMPHLSDDDREFIMTGITVEEWANTFYGGDRFPV